MIKYVINLDGRKIEFKTLVEAQNYASENSVNVQIQMIDDVSATDIKPKHYQTITRKQAKKALVLSGVALESIDVAINSMPEPQKTLSMIEWQDSSVLERDHDLVILLGSMIGLREDQIDSLWELATTL